MQDAQRHGSAVPSPPEFIGFWVGKKLMILEQHVYYADTCLPHRSSSSCPSSCGCQESHCGFSKSRIMCVPVAVAMVVVVTFTRPFVRVHVRTHGLPASAC